MSRDVPDRASLAEGALRHVHTRVFTKGPRKGELGNVEDLQTQTFKSDKNIVQAAVREGPPNIDKAAVGSPNITPLPKAIHAAWLAQRHGQREAGWKGGTTCACQAQKPGRKTICGC